MQQLNQRINGACTFGTNVLPLFFRHRRDIDGDFVEFGTHHLRRHFAFGDVQIDYRTVAHIRASARQAVFVIAIAFKIVAPRFAPEGFGNHALGNYRRKRLAFFLHLGGETFGFGATLGG